MAKLKTLKEAGEATGIGLSTIRKYLSEFGELVPVEKGPRNALLFGTEAVKALKTIREAYQEKLSHEEIKAKLSGKKLPRSKKAAAPVAEEKGKKGECIEYERQFIMRGNSTEQTMLTDRPNKQITFRSNKFTYGTP